MLLLESMPSDRVSLALCAESLLRTGSSALLGDAETKDIFGGVDEGEGRVFLVVEQFNLEILAFEVDQPAYLGVLVYVERSLPSCTSRRINSRHSQLTSGYF